MIKFQIKVGEITPVFEDRRYPALSVRTKKFHEVRLHLSDDMIYPIHRCFPIDKIEFTPAVIAALDTARKVLMALEDSEATNHEH